MAYLDRREFIELEDGTVIHHAVIVAVLQIANEPEIARDFQMHRLGYRSTIHTTSGLIAWSKLEVSEIKRRMFAPPTVGEMKAMYPELQGDEPAED